ncbi:hypothetical protein V8C86DRAFT_1074191 [Haematococcus lacustris]
MGHMCAAAPQLTPPAAALTSGAAATLAGDCHVTMTMWMLLFSVVGQSDAAPPWLRHAAANSSTCWVPGSTTPHTTPCPSIASSLASSIASSPPCFGGARRCSCCYWHLAMELSCSAGWCPALPRPSKLAAARPDCAVRREGGGHRISPGPDQHPPHPPQALPNLAVPTNTHNTPGPINTRPRPSLILQWALPYTQHCPACSSARTLWGVCTNMCTNMCTNISTGQVPHRPSKHAKASQRWVQSTRPGPAIGASGPTLPCTQRNGGCCPRRVARRLARRVLSVQCVRAAV